MAAELAIIAKLQDEASSGIRALRGEVEGLGGAGDIAAQGFASLQTVGTAALGALAAAAIAVGGAIASSIGVASEFEDSVTILSIAAKGAGESFDSMRAAAMAVGADTSLVGVSASQAADAMTLLYKAGMTTGEIFGDLNGYLSGNVELSGALRAAIDGAAASELDMAQAADLAATTLATFGGSLTTAEERAQFVNVALNNFVQAADASNASVADLAAAMQTIGPTAAQFGFSLQDTNTALAILSTRGIAGSEAGTALKSMFVNLMRPTDDVRGALAELNVSLYNADGTMRSMPQIIGDLSQALYGMNEVTTIAGGRTAEQNHQLELAQRSYDQATDAIYKHNAGLKVLTDSNLQKYVDQQAAANAEIERLSAITGTASTAVSQLTEEQRNQYIQTLAGSYGMKAMAVLLMEGVEGWTAMERAIASAATIQEVAAARTATFSGAMEALSGVVETIQIGIGSAFLPVLTALTRVLADLAAGALPYVVGAFEALGGALASFFDAVMAGTNPITAFADAVRQMAEALGMPAEQAALLRDQIEGVLTAIGNVVGPIWEAITSFISWKDVLAAVGIAIGSVVIPALIAIVQFLAPIIATIAAVILAVAALRNAWESDFLGIRSAVEGAVEIFGRFVEAIRVLTDENARIQAMVDALAKLPEPLQLLAAAVASFINTLRDGGSLVEAFRAGLETLKQAIFDWAGTTNWGEIGGIILDKIAAAFSNLGDRVATTAAGILNWITTSVNSIDWVAVGTAIVNGIAAAITGVVGLLAAAGTAISGFFNGFFTNESLATAGTNIVTAIGNAISGAAAGIATGLDSIRQAIFNWAGVTSWSEVGGVILDRIAETFRNLGDKVAQLEADLFNWIANAVNGIDFRQVGESIINGIVAAISAVVGLLVSAGTAIVNYFIGFFTNDELGPAAQNLITSLGNAIGEFAGGIVDGLVKVRDAIFNWAEVEDWSGVAEKIIEMIGNAIGTAASFVSEKMAALEQAIFTWAGVEDWSGVAGKIIEMIGNAIGAAVTSVAAAMSALEQAIFDWAGVEDWSGVAGKIIEMIGNAIGAAVTSVAAAMSALEQAIFDWAGVEDWSGVAGKIIEMIGNAIGAVASSINEKLSALEQAFLDWAGVEDWSGVGEKIAEEVGQAANDAADKLTDQLDKWGQEFLDWAEVEDWSEVGGAIAEKVGQAASDAKDSLTTGLSEWTTSIVDWTDTEDFSEGGLNIVLSVIEGLGEFANEVGTKVSEWLGDLTAEIEKIDWYDAGYQIAYGVAEELGAFVGLVGEKIEEWRTNIADEAAKIDWKAAADAILQGITDKLINISTFLTEKLPAWIEQFKTQTAGMAWHEVALVILAGIVANLFGINAVPGHDLGSSVASWKDAIKAKVQEKIAEFNSIGADIIAGIADGLSSGTEALRLAVQGVVDGIIAGFNTGLDRHSPAGVMIPIGSDITAGVAVGITQNVGAVISAIQQVAQAIELEGVRAFGEAMQAIAAGIAAALSAILDIGSFQGGSEGFGAAMQTLVDMIAAMVAAVAQANIYTAEVLENLGAFVEAAEAISDLLVQTADVVDYIARWRPPDISATNDAIRLLADFLNVMVQGVLSLGIEAMLLLGALGDFVDTAAQLPELFMGVADIASYLAGWQAPSLEPVIANVQQLAALLGVLVTAVAGANTMGLGMLDIVATFTETAAGIVALIAPLADAMLDIANFPPGAEFSIMQRNIETMAGYLAQIVTAVAGANTMGLLSLEQLGAFVEVAADIVGLIDPMAQAMLGIANFPQGADVQVMARNIEMMAGYLHDLVGAIAESNTWGQLTLELLDQFVQVAGDIAELITPLAEAIWNIANFRSPDLFAFVGGIATLAGHLSTIVAWFYSGLNLSQAALEALGQYVEVMASIADGMASFIDAIAAIAAFEPPDLFTFIGNVATLAGHLATMVVWFYSGLNLGQAALEALGQYIEVMASISEGMVSFIDAIAAIVAFQPPDLFVFVGNMATLAGHLATMVVWFYNGLNLSMAALEALGQYVEVIGDMVDLIADAIEALGLIAGYSGNTAVLGPAIASFAADLLLLVQTLATSFTSASAAALAAILAAGEFTDAIGDILGVVEDGVEALVALATYVSAANLVPTTQQFAADLATVITTVVAALQQAGILASTAIVAAGELADGLGDVLGMVEDGVGALVELASYIPTAGLGALAQQFATDLAVVITVVVNALVAAQLLANEAVVKAGELAGGLADILGVVADGVEAITALAAYIPAAGIGEKAQRFAVDLAAVVLAIVNGLVQAGLLANQAVAVAADLAGRLGDLLGVVAQGIEAIKAIAEYQGVAELGAKVQKFTSDLIAVAIILSSQLATAAQVIGIGTIDAARAFAAAVTALVAEVQAAVTGLGQLGGLAMPNIQPVLTYIVASAQLIQTSFSAAGDIGAAVAYAAAFRANLQQLVAEIQQAVALLNQIAGTGTTGTIGAALAAIAASLQNTAGQFAGAGTVLANALIAALTAGINAGQGSVQGATVYMLEAVRAAGENTARNFTSVGNAIIDAVSSAVLSGQGQVIAAVTQVVNAAIAAGVAAARAAASIGQQLIQAALTEVNNGRGQLDSAGSAAGNALIDGMARAITSGRSRVVNAIIATVTAAINAAKAALGIASPSKVAIDLLSNFMNTAARTVEGLRGRLADSMAAAVSGAAAAAATGLNGVRLTPATVPGFASPALSDSLGERASFAAGRGKTAEYGSGANHTQVVFYGNVVLPNVVDSRSFLEELDALRGGA